MQGKWRNCTSATTVHPATSRISRRTKGELLRLHVRITRIENGRSARDFPALCEALDSTGQKGNEKKLREKSLFYCDFSDGTVCGLKIQNDNNAVIVRNNQFNYLSFKVSASQKVSIEMPVCAWVRFNRETPIVSITRTDEGEAKGGTSQTTRSGRCSSKRKPRQLAGGRLDSRQVEWYQCTIDPEVDGPLTSITLTFDVPAGASEQYSEFKSIVLTRGKCQYS